MIGTKMATRVLQAYPWLVRRKDGEFFFMYCIWCKEKRKIFMKGCNKFKKIILIIIIKTETHISISKLRGGGTNNPNKITSFIA